MKFEWLNRHSLVLGIASVAIIAPWLNPFSSGPTPAVLPLLFSWICILAVLGGGRVMVAAALAVAGGAWLVAALVSAGMGLLQYFGASDAFFPWISSTAPGEAYANLRQRNQFATLTNIGLAALLGWAVRLNKITESRSRASDVTLPGRVLPPDVPEFFSNSPSQQNAFARRHLIADPLQAQVQAQVQAQARRGVTLACAGAAALLAVGNAASSSRTGLVQLLLLLALAGLWGQWRRPAVRPLLWVAALAYALASASLPWLAGLDASSTGILARLNEGGGPACASRLTLWGNVLHLIAQKPWLGWGWGELDYAHFITLYPGARFCEILDNAHNLPLHLAVELGVPIALLICGGGLWLVWRAKPWREGDATKQMAWSVLAVIMLHSLLEYPLWYGPFQMAVLLCIGLLRYAPDALHASVLPQFSLTNGNRGSNMTFSHVLYRLFAIFIIVLLTFAAWDYHRISQIYLPPEDRAPDYRSHTLTKIQATWLFQNQARFALLTISPVTSDNAAHVNLLAHDLLHFSPEARVVEKLIDSARLLGREDEATYYAARYGAAFPAEHDAWAQKKGMAR